MNITEQEVKRIQSLYGIISESSSNESIFVEDDCSGKISSYVVATDSGFAPNPYGGKLTLATCKPVIRKGGQVGDLLLGFKGGKLIYCGLVSKVLSFQDYDKFCQSGFPCKTPDKRNKLGDNIFDYSTGEPVVRDQSIHQKPELLQRDLRGKNVLICDTFWYFGKNAIELPEQFGPLVKKGIGHKNTKDNKMKNDLLEWLSKNYSTGIHGKPYDL